MKQAKTIAAFVVAAAALYFVPWRMGNLAAGIDFYQFWAGAQLARETPNLYAPETRQGQYQTFQQRAFARDESNNLLVAARTRTEFEFFSTPFLYTTFALLPDRYDTALLLYRIVSLLAFAAGVVLLARACGLSWSTGALILAAAALLYEPLKSEVRVVNVNSVQLFVIALALYVRPPMASGALLAVVTAFKPNLAPVLPLLLITRGLARDWTRLKLEAIGAIIGAAFAVVVSSIYFRGFDAWLEWLARARTLAATLLPLDAGNVAPALRFASLSIFIAIAFSIVVLIRARRTSFVVALGLLVYLLSATLVWLHYLILALPAAIALIGERSWIPRTAGIVAMSLVGLDVWMFVFRISDQRSMAVVLWIGLAILFAGCVVRARDAHHA